MQIRIKLDGIPWAMAAGRALLGPVVIVGERCGWSGAALAGMVVAALVSDIFDGILARRWACDSPAVRLFDSMSDTVFYLCVAIAISIGHPQVWHGNAGLLAVLMGLEALRLVLEFWKYGKPASYHSYLAKAWGLVMAIAVVGVFAWPGAAALLPVALGFGIACDGEGLAMSAMLPVWRRDVKTLRAAWVLRKELEGDCVPTARSVKVSVTAAMALLLLALPASAAEPGRAAYAGGTAKVALDTAGTLDATSPAELVFTYKESNGTPGEIGIAYAKIRSFEPRQDVVRHLGFLPAVGAGLVAARQRRYTVTISYVDSSDAVQVAIFQMAERDQLALKGILRARAPQSCLVTQYNACAGNPGTRPVTAAAPR